jgi:hypothetical protein
MPLVTSALFAERNRQPVKSSKMRVGYGGFSGLQTVPATRNAASEMNASVVLDAMRVELHTGHGHP